jgi:hypothetical protein
MLKINMFRFLLLFCLGVIIFSCTDDDEGNNNSIDSGSTKFLIAYDDGEEGETDGIYEFTYSDGGSLSKKLIPNFYPRNLQLASIDNKNGKIAFISDDELLMYGSVSDYSFSEVPEVLAEEGYVYYHDKWGRPQITNDGRVVYSITHDDTGYDDWQEGQFAIYNPTTDLTDLSGGLTIFIKAQPEKEWDTEVGSTTGEFCLSPDDQFIYFTSYAFGTDAGAIHTDYYILTRYEIATGEYERIAATDASVQGVSSDGKYLFTMNYPDLEIYDVSNVTGVGDISPTVFNDVAFDNIRTGQTSGDAVLLNRRGDEGFVSIYSVSGGYTELASPTSLEPRDYLGLGYGVQFGSGNNVYFTASNDLNTNYETGFDVMKVNKNNSSELDSLFRVEENFDIGLFLFLK